MKNQIKVGKGNPYPNGVTSLSGNCINVAVAMQSEDCGMILFGKMNEPEKIPFDTTLRIGDLYCVKIEGIEVFDYTYCFYDGDRMFVDKYARCVSGNEKYGHIPAKLQGRICRNSFDWENDKNLQIPFHDSLLYLLHVRGFSKHKSSGVKAKGTFEGIIEKIPYLQEIGINGLVLMPSYEFLEIEEPLLQNDWIPLAYSSKESVLNYWGYKEGYYYAPKSAYASDKKNPVGSFKNMVKQLHKNGIEVLMQFYFPNTVSGLYIVDVLRYWVCEYHVDGFWLSGEKVPAEMLAADALLKKTKLIYYGFPVTETAAGVENVYQNLAKYSDEYMYDIRRFLKSDERTLRNTLQHMKMNPPKQKIVHYITEANGFTLADLVSYDRKHNDDNGEKNQDGNLYNASWNCGAEGKTKKKSVLDLRMKQMKNAFLLTLFTQSTPLLLAGDEFSNSQNGNNNAYCQDNAISWLNWNDLEKNRELFDFVKSVVSFRKEHALLHRSTEYTMVDDLACGYPDLSYHSDEPWKCRYDDLTRHFGMLYCGNYSENENEKGTFIYLAVNMHWIPHDFVLPKLPKKMKWQLKFDTSVRGEAAGGIETEKITIKERSIQVLIAG